MAEGEGPFVAEFFRLRRNARGHPRAGERIADPWRAVRQFCRLPEGYLSKLVGARPIRRLGMVSFAPVLAGLGLRCLFVIPKGPNA